MWYFEEPYLNDMKPIRFWLAYSGLALAMSHATASDSGHTYTLQKAIDIALSNNPELHIMQARIAQADAQLGEALSSFYPQIKTSLAYQHSNNPAQAFAMIIAQRRLDMSGSSSSFNYPGFVDNYRPQVSASYSLFRGGQDYFNSQAAELNRESLEFETSAARNRLLNHVTSAYYSELAARDADRVSQRAIDAVSSELKQSQAGFQAGSILKSDVLSLEVQLAETQDAQIHAHNAVEIAHSMLRTLMGIEVTEDFDLQAEPQQQLPGLPAELAVLLDQALNQHPELKAAEKRVAIAEQQLSAAQAAHLPRADAMISYGSDSKNLNYSSNRDNMTAGLVVEMDLFSGFATQEKIHKAEHQLTAAQEQARQLRLTIEDQLKSARLRLQETLNRFEISLSACKAAEEALRLVTLQRQAGTVTITRFLEAQVAFDKALNRQINARFEALRAEADLKQAMGTW